MRDPGTAPAAGPSAPDGQRDPSTLAAALRRAVDGEVRFSPGDRHLYATDASNFRQLPIGVVVPRSVEDVVAAVGVCRDFGAPITNRGGGTSLAGQATNDAVILDTSKYLRGIVDVDPDARRATVEAGVVLDDLRDAVRPLGLTWGPDPATHNRCTVGGMIGNNACGVHAFRYGRTDENVAALDVLLYDGTRITVGNHSTAEADAIIASGGRRGELYAALRDLAGQHADAIRAGFPDIPRRVSGFNLPHLLEDDGRFEVARALVGTEGTCVTVLHATVELNRHRPHRSLLALGYPDVFTAGDAVADIRERSTAIALEGFDQRLVDNIEASREHASAVKHLPPGGGWLLVEFGADTRAEAAEQARALMGRLGDTPDAPTMRHYDDPREQQVVWAARKAGLGVTAHVDGRDHWPGWEDAAVAPADVGDYLRDLRVLLDDHGLDAAMYGHFGDGCIHTRIDFDLATEDGVATYRRFLDDAADLVSSYGGSYSGEHGDGQQRGPLLERMYGAELIGAFRDFKALFDPDGRMNPGKVVDPRPVDADLRLGPGYGPWDPDTVFAYPDDADSFARASLRCVGVGACRRDDGAGTMCPSYMVTHEERHSTRGRARLLFEMLQPNSDLDGWHDESVREALDLCLSCKGCTTDCPVNVDIPTYKAEFLHHHYDGRLHPRVHYALGLIDRWSTLASWVPGLANAALRAPVLGGLLRRAGGIAPQRPAPTFAGETFREWFAARDDAARGRLPARNGHVVLFPDTFVEHFDPQVGRATVAVLEDAGYSVSLPAERLCCGRPLYDHGFLDRARRYLDRLVEVLGPEVAAGTAIVGMEPSCVATFRDELERLRPDDPAARRLAASTHTLAEFLVDVADYDFPTLDRRAVVHGHCHHKAAMGLSADAAALDRLGLDWDELDAGCCGLAGSFGFEAGEKYEVSVAAGERKLLPAVRAADRDTLILADGFSCRTQVDHLQRLNGSGEQGPRRALHLAQVIQMARSAEAGRPLVGARGPVEAGWVDTAEAGWGRKELGAALAASAGLLAGALSWAWRSR